MRKLLFMGLLLAFWQLPAHASCSGSSPNWSSTPDSSSLQNCINNASSGDTINVSAGSATWSSPVTTPGNKALTITGATICTGSGNPNGGSGGVISCQDNTIITLAAAEVLNVSSSSAGLVTISGFTFIATASTANGNIQLQGAHGQVSFRFHHNHIEMPTSGAVAINANGGYGLIDHVYWQDTTSGGGAAVPLNIGGDFGTRGYLNWNDPTQLGTNQAIYVEDSYYINKNTTIGAEGFFDAYYGAKIVVRYNTIIGNQIGGGHGTDSGQYRGVVSYEIYGNSISNSTGHSSVILNTRSGTLLFWNNVVGGSTPWQSIDLQFYRISEQIGVEISKFGAAGSGLNWTPVSSNASNINSDLNTLNAPDWRANQAYAAGAVVGPKSNNSGGYNYQNQGGPCTSGGSEPSFNQNIPGTNGDGSCTWTNVGGSNQPSTAPGTAGFDAANPDTMCSSGSTCTRYFDNAGGSYPFRDQPGVVHNQVAAPNYEWGNSGSGLPNPVLETDGSTNSIISANRDYFNESTNFTGASGTGQGALSASPSSCSAGVGYWATDTATLYQCNSGNNWVAYYTPYTYPHPLTQGQKAAPPAPTNLVTGVQ